MPKMKYWNGSAFIPLDAANADTLDNKNYEDTFIEDMARQAIIDGNFQIAQANPVVGTVVTNPPAVSYPVFDMWKYYVSSDGGTLPTINHSQQVISLGNVPNSYYCYRLNSNGAGTSLGANSFAQITQYIENGAKYLCGSGKKVTVSFYARSTISAKRLGVLLEQYYGSGGTPSATELLTGNNVTLTSVWTKFSYTFTTNTLSGKTFGTNNDDSLILSFRYVWGSNFNSSVGASTAETFRGSGDIEIAQVQLCAGDVALPFMPKSFDEELRACQRYYEKSYSYSDKPSTSTNSNIVYMLMPSNTITNGQAYNSVPYKLEKRISPTISIYSKIGTLSQISNNNGSDLGTGSATVAGVSGTKSFALYNNNGASLTITNNIIMCHFVADARF